jgi:hypothetical protein
VKEVEKSSMANIKNVGRFAEESNISPVLLELEAFINKVRNDIIKGEITEEKGNNLINKATNFLNMISMSEEG